MLEDEEEGADVNVTGGGVVDDADAAGVDGLEDTSSKFIIIKFVQLI